MGGVRRVRDHDDELVGHVPGEGVAGREPVGEPLGDRQEQPVADAVAEAVVHLGETVDIQEEHGHEARRLPGAAEGLLEAVLEEGPIRQAR